MSAIQLDLLKPGPPPVSAMDLAWMLGELRGQGWRTTADLGAETESAKRKLRAIAKASRGEIISGQLGYRLTREACQDEYLQARDWMNSQADEMKQRVIEIDRAWHNRPKRGDADAPD